MLSWILLSSSFLPVFAQVSQLEDREQILRREQWFMRGRAIPSESAAALRYRAHLQKLQMRAAQAAAAKTEPLAQPAAVQSGWAPLGPAPLASDASGFGQQDYDWVSGRATAIAVDPSDNTGNTIYLGGAYGGVWKSTNAGSASQNAGTVAWTPMTDNQATLAVGSIAIQPGNTNAANSVVLVGTGETNSSEDSYYGLGILRSTNAGSTWTLISQSSDTPARAFAGLGFSKIAFSTINPSLVVAAAASASQGVIENLEGPSTNRGIYYSTDSGQTWLFASVTDGGVTVAPGSVTSVAYNAGAGLFFAALRYHGIYSSADGINWTRLTTQPGPGLTLTACPTNPASSSCPIYRGELAVVPGRNEMYAWYVDVSSNDQGIWKSTNGGSSWTQLSETGITACGDPIGCGTSQGIYNLALTAVPNGSVTDLYAGAINLYKCTITTGSPTCSGTGSNTFLNLTHAYGCSAIAKVHPNQHDADFIVANGKALLYFANDGGLYRALDGFTGLTTGTCGLTNQFDSLNQTLGSMTQFVSFSQSATNLNILLGGTPGNGSPATASSQTSTQWLNVNAGDGGYNQINPGSPNEWFTANTDVTIQRCTSGIACHSQDFSYVVESADLAGDHGDLYTPYILDPQVSASELIVGTCRVWRGPGAGGTFTQLSPNFETGSPTAGCTGNELVRSLATGGTTVGGFSNVIYAGTDGIGPTVATFPTGGHVWVSTNAAGGTSTWVDRTGSINPNHFPVADIAIDPTDVNGLTAYATIMGFHVPHVWKTTDGGATWSDFTANLPDAPANAVVVDPSATLVYVGTDVGVFSSLTGIPNWTELGPTPNSGQSGYLPNVAVTALRIFNSGGVERLRASTYGRGIWDFDLLTAPNYAINIFDSVQTIFPTENAVFSGTLTATGGYNGVVTLSCTGGKPATCNPNPIQITPTPVGANFAVTASDVIADYSFNIHGVGNDVNVTTHDAPVTLHIVDFGLTAPSPDSLTVNRPNTSPATTFQVTAAGSFSGTVNLSCGLPPGATCFFVPSSVVSPRANAPVTVTLTIGTSITTPPAIYGIAISANTAGAPAAKIQNLTLTVTAFPDYTLVADGGAQTTTVNQSLTLNGTLTAYNGYTSPVNVACTGNPPSTCNASPGSVTPTPAGAPVTVTVASAAAGTYDFDITGVGTDGSQITHGVPVSLTVDQDFSLNSSGPQTVRAGQTASYTLNLAPVGAPTFDHAITYTCSSGLPPLSSCSFSPARIAAGDGATPVTLSIATTGPNPAQIAHSGQPVGLQFLFGLPALGLVLLGLSGRVRLCGPRRAADLGLIISAVVILLSCGGGGGGGEPPPGGGGDGGVIEVAISPTSASVFTGQTQQFTATVSGAGNTQVNWSVNQVAGGNSTLGAIDGSGLYTAPNAVPNPSTVTVSAVSQESSAKSASASVRINAGTSTGTYSITVTADSGGLQHSTQVTLTVH